MYFKFGQLLCPDTDRMADGVDSNMIKYNAKQSLNMDFRHKLSTIFILIALLLMPIANALSMSKAICIDDRTLEINTSIYVYKNSTTPTNITVQKQINCTYACTNGKCEGEIVAGDINAMWLIYATGTVLLILGTILGIPYGKFTGQEEIYKGFDTTLVVKYMFFFVGFFLIYLSLGMCRRMEYVSGGEGNVIGATDTATMVIMITMMLFLFIFVIELLFTVLKWWMHKKDVEKRGEEE